MCAVKGLMSKKLVTTRMGTTLARATDLMDEHRIRHLPVLDDEQNVVGILSQRDVDHVPNADFLLVDHFMRFPVAFISDERSHADGDLSHAREKNLVPLDHQFKGRGGRHPDHRRSSLSPRHLAQRRGDFTRAFRQRDETSNRRRSRKRTFFDGDLKAKRNGVSEWI